MAKDPLKFRISFVSLYWFLHRLARKAEVGIFTEGFIHAAEIEKEKDRCKTFLANQFSVSFLYETK